MPTGVAVGRDVAPEWRKISNGDSVRWHDHRTHRMQVGLPPEVVSAPDSFHHLQVARVKFVHDGITSNATVTLDWVPGPSGIGWLPVILVVCGLTLAAALVGRRLRVLAGLIVLLVVLDAGHAIAYEIARSGTNLAKTGAILRRRRSCRYSCGSPRCRRSSACGVVAARRCTARSSSALMVALVGGAADLSVLWSSQLPFAGSAFFTRLEVSLALGIGSGVALGALARVVFFEQPDAARSPDDESTRRNWLAMLVVGLSEDELRRVVSDLDVDEVLDAALDDLARRLNPCVEMLRDAAFVFDVVAGDETGRHQWSILARGDEVVAERGVHEPIGAEVAVAFPLLLQLLAGTVAFDDAVSAARVSVRGDPSVVAATSRCAWRPTTTLPLRRVPLPITRLLLELGHTGFELLFARIFGRAGAARARSGRGRAAHRRRRARCPRSSRPTGPPEPGGDGGFTPGVDGGREPGMRALLRIVRRSGRRPRPCCRAATTPKGRRPWPARRR